MSNSGMTAAYQNCNPRLIVFAPKRVGSLFWNARGEVKIDELTELRDSIRDDGLLEEIVCRKLPDGTVQVICGECRLRCILDLIEKNEDCWDLLKGKRRPATELFATIKIKILVNCSDKQASRISVAENIKRKQLTEWQLMEYCRELIDLQAEGGELAYSRNDIKDIIGRSPTWISQTMSLYKLDGRIKKLLSDGTLHRTVALGFLSVDSEQVLDVLEQAIEIATTEVEEAKQKAIKEVKDLEQESKVATLNLAGAEVAGTQEERKSAKRTKSLIDKKLQEAQGRKTTAIHRTPKITADSIAQASDTLQGARVGRHPGMSQKAVRQKIKDIKEILKNNEKVVHAKLNREIEKRDIELVLMGLQMVLGEIRERNILEVLAHRYIQEGREGWNIEELIEAEEAA